MTNKVKPFYIKITDDMTPQMVQDAFDKCVALGAKENERANEDWFEKLPYFGVCAEDGTYFGIDGGAYVDAQEITLDQLDEWLGLEAEQEWKNGDECVIENDAGYAVLYEHEQLLGKPAVIVSLFSTVNGTKMAAVQHEIGDCVCWRLDMLSKPETPKQKPERERLEAAYDLYVSWQNGNELSFDDWSNYPSDVSDWLRIVDKTNYRKQ